MRGLIPWLLVWGLGLGSSWAIDPTFRPGVGANAPVFALAVQGNHAVLVGGFFTEFDGVARTGFARLDANGAVDASWNITPGILNTVSAIVVQSDGRMVLASTEAGPSGRFVARFNLDGSLDDTFQATVDGPVHALAIGADGAIWIGGGFRTVNGDARPYIACLNSSGQVDAGFTGAADPNENVLTLLPHPNGGMYVGGQFTALGGVTAGGIGLLKRDGSVELTFAAPVGANGPIRSLALQADGKILAGGQFSSFNDVSAGNLVRLLSDGAIDPEFQVGAGASGRVNALLVKASGRILVGGDFPSFNGVPQARLARLFQDGSVDDCFGPGSGTGINGSVFALATQASGPDLFGGAFTSAFWVAASRIAAASGEEPAAQAPRIFEVTTDGSDAPFYDPGDTVTVTAKAASCFGWPRYQWFKQDSVNPTPTVPHLIPNATNLTIVLRNLHTNDAGNYLLVASNSSASSTQAVRISVLKGSVSPGKVNIEFDTWNGLSGWNEAGRPAAVLSVLPLRNGQVMVGGQFLKVEGADWPHLARLNADGSLDRSFSARPNRPVRAMLEQPDGRILIAGEFNVVDGQFRDRVARLEPDGRLDTNFQVRLGLNGVMHALAQQPDGKIFVGGGFHVARANEPWIHNLVRLETNGAIDLTFDVGTQLRTTNVGVNFVQALAVMPDGRVVAGGTFSKASGSQRDHLAWFHPHGRLDDALGFRPFLGPNGPVHCLALQPEGLLIIGGQFTNVNGFARTNLARLLPNGSVDESFRCFLTEPAFSTRRVNAVSVDAGGRVTLVTSDESQGSLRSSRIFRTDGRGNQDATFFTPTFPNPFLGESAILALAGLPFGGAYIGGDFVNVDNTVRRKVALLLGDAVGPPVFTAQPTHVTVDAGLDILLTTSVTVSGPTTFQWMRDDAILPGRTNVLLILPAAMPSESGQYALVVSNGFGAVTSEVATVTVNDPRRPGAVDLAFAPRLGANSNVFALALGPQGSVYVGGDFTQVGSVPVTGLARLDRFGKMDTNFLPRLSNSVPYLPSVLCLQLRDNGTLLVGGFFSHANGKASTHLTSLRADGQIDPDFSFDNRFQYNPGIRALTVDDQGRIFAGGYFTVMNGIARQSYLIRLLPNGTHDSGFTFGGGGNNLVALYINALARDTDGNVLSAGIDLRAGRDLIRLDELGFRDPRFGFSGQFPCVLNDGGTRPSPTESDCGGVRSLVIQPDGRIVAGGLFASGFHQYSNCFFGCSHVATNLVRINSDDTLDEAFNAQTAPNGPVNKIALQKDGKLVISGSFTQVRGMPRNGLARLNSNGSLDQSWDVGAGPNGAIEALMIREDGQIVVGGRFTRFNGHLRGGVAVLNGGPAEAPHLLSAATNLSFTAGQPLKLATLVAGYPAPMLQWLFNGVPLPGENGLTLRRVNSSLSQSGTYSVVLSNTYGMTTNLVATVTVSPPPLQAGVIDPSFGAGLGADGGVSAILAQPDRRILLAGSFRQVQGVPRAGVARLLSNGSLDVSFNPGSGLSELATGSVSVAHLGLQQDGKLLLSGSFKQFDGMLRNGLARLNVDGSLDTAFDVTADGFGANGPVLVQPDGKILISGDFTTVNGVARLGLARLFPDGGVDGTFDSPLLIPERPHALAMQADGKILWCRSTVRRILPDGAFDETFSLPTGLHPAFWNPTCVGSVGGAQSQPEIFALKVQADGAVLIAGLFAWHSPETSANRLNVARVLPSGDLDPEFNVPTNNWAGPNDAVWALETQPDGKVLLGGCFTAVGNTNLSAGEVLPWRSHIARLNADGTLDAGFNPGARYAHTHYGTVRALVRQEDGRILVGGQFDTVAGVRRNNFARLGDEVVLFESAGAGSEFSTRIATTEGRTYWLEWSSTVEAGTWTVVDTVSGDGTPKTLQHSLPVGGHSFYRVRAE